MRLHQITDTSDPEMAAMTLGAAGAALAMFAVGWIVCRRAHRFFYDRGWLAGRESAAPDG